MSPPPTRIAPGKLYVTWRLAGSHCDWDWEAAVAASYREQTPAAIRDGFTDVPIEVPVDACVAEQVLRDTVQAQVDTWNAARVAASIPGTVAAQLDAGACEYRAIDSTTVCVSDFSLTIAGAQWKVADPDGQQDDAVLRLTYEYELPLP